MVAGKGHEKYQEISGKKYFFDDKEVVLKNNRGTESLMVSSWNYEELKQITNGSNSGKIKNLKVTGFSIDSRSLKKGDLFCALKGKNFDGHDYLFQAYKKGAACFLIK